jgi:hypothetical protein
MQCVTGFHFYVPTSGITLFGVASYKLNETTVVVRTFPSG